MRGSKLGLLAMFVLGLYVLLEYTPVHSYVLALKIRGSVQPVSAVPTGSYSWGAEMESEELLAAIEAKAAQLKEEPVNAKVDPVWKAIPGYNGIEVDIQKTLEVNRGKRQGNRLELIMREIEPDIQLADLGAYPIYKGNPQKRMAGFMINVAWGDEYIPEILEILREENISATFFFDGSWLSRNIETARAICRAGHECSNHAYSHPNMSQLSRVKQADQIIRTEKLLKEELAVDNVWFAPPSGDYNQTTVEVAYELGLRTVLWTIDTVDWKQPEPDWIVRRIRSQLEPGSLILMHPTASSLGALPGMIAAIRERGLAFGTVSDVLSSERVTIVEQIFDF